MAGLKAKSAEVPVKNVNLECMTNPVYICVPSFGIIFMSLNTGEDTLYQLLCSRGENIQIIINQLGMTVKNSGSNNDHLFSWNAGRKNLIRTVVVEFVPSWMFWHTHTHIDCEIWDCGTVLWNPPWPLSEKLMTCAFSRGTSFFFYRAVFFTKRLKFFPWAS